MIFYRQGAGVQDRVYFQDFSMVSPDAIFICGSSAIFQVNNPAIKIETIIANIH